MERRLRSRFDRYRCGQRGFSLIEVVLVILIMGILAAVAAQKWGGALEQSRFDATRGEMDNLATAIAGNPALVANGMRSDFGYVGDVGSLPPNLDALVTNPGGYATWNGPYIQNDFTQNPNDYKQDAWGKPYGYDGGVTIASTGSGSTLTKTFAGAASDLMGNSIAGSVTDGLDNPPGGYAASIAIRVDYPNGIGGMTSRTTAPSAGGSFSFIGVIPVGNRTVTAIYNGDTLTRYVSVLPKSTAYVSFRFPGGLWGEPGGRRSNRSGLAYVSGSESVSNSGTGLSFDLVNSSGANVSLTSMQAAYGAGIYYEQMLVGGTLVFSDASKRGGSGEIRKFPAIEIDGGQTVTVEFLHFKQCASGNCADGYVGGRTYTITLSTGDTFNLTVPVS